MACLLCSTPPLCLCWVGGPPQGVKKEPGRTWPRLHIHHQTPMLVHDTPPAPTAFSPYFGMARARGGVTKFIQIFGAIHVIIHIIAGNSFEAGRIPYSSSSKEGSSPSSVDKANLSYMPRGRGSVALSLHKGCWYCPMQLSAYDPYVLPERQCEWWMSQLVLLFLPCVMYLQVMFSDFFNLTHFVFIHPQTDPNLLKWLPTPQSRINVLMC